MKITFLGSGGGRFTTINQMRMTGGFRIDDIDKKNIHVDPGPGALIRTYEFGLNPKNLDGVFVSHAHTDHYSDAEILIESMTQGMIKEKGFIIGSESVLKGYEQWGPCISKYHQSKSENIILDGNTSKKLGNLNIKGTSTDHGDPIGIGFQMEYDGLKISYTADTKYSKQLAEDHEGANILIASVLRPGNTSIPGHMTTKQFIDLINDIKPDLAIMTHFGIKMIRAKPIQEALKIKKETKTRVLAAVDGLTLDINTDRPSKSKMSIIQPKFQNPKSSK